MFYALLFGLTVSVMILLVEHWIRVEQQRVTERCNLIRERYL